MGFVRDTAIITDADLFEIGFEQEITNVLRESGETDLSKLRKAATNLIIRDCKSLRIDPTLVSNTEDFEFEAVYWCLMSLYRGEEPDQLGRRMKFDEYKKAWETQKATRVFELSTGETLLADGSSQGMPQIANQDTTAFFPPTDNAGTGLTGRTLISDPYYHRSEGPGV